ncbi:MAG: TolC family protein [Gemmatimonadota bacterium]
MLAPAAAPFAAHGQLTLGAAQDAARRASPELHAAREGVAAAAARERQAGAFPNPTFAYGREQTSRAGQTNAQDIVQLEQPIEIGRQRGARREAARLRREAAEARLAATTAQLDFEVTRAFALAVAADRRARLAGQTTEAFTEAQRVSDRRLAAGDVSGYVARRLRLESARFAAVRAAAALDRRSTRIALAALMGIGASGADTLVLPDELAALPGDSAVTALDSLLARAERSRGELRAAALDAEAASADASVVRREWTPTPTLSAGYKGERVADPVRGSLTGFTGIVAGLSLPLPLFDRRSGAMDAADADARRVHAEGAVVRRRVAREVADALAGLLAAEAQRAALAPHLGEGARVAVRAVQASYAEGEITLVEWLDAIRAYQDAESTYVSLQAEVAIRRAALARAVGAPLTLTASDDR